MPYPILATKLHLPRLRSQALSRPALIQRLNEGLLRQGQPLALVCAPAGYGKTTLVIEWLLQVPSEIPPGVGTSPGESPAYWKRAWLSLDEEDDDPLRFLAYFVAAIRTVYPSTGAALLPLLEGSQPPPLETLVSLLVYDLVELPTPLILVLDDVHLLQSEYIQRFLRRLVDHLPPALHLVLVTRQEPFLPLGRLRSRSLITELRTGDLRFDLEESKEFLTGCMHLALKAEWMADLSQLTEGWAAGLQLAGLSIPAQPDFASFLQNFHRRQPFVIDYLVKEVLNQLSDELHSFLLDTAVLNRLSAPLCNAITGRDDSQEILEQLLQKNLFLVPLDDEWIWFRYHGLFADLLQHQLRLKKKREEIDRLHSRAVQWLEANGEVSEAIQHARAIQDWKLIEQIILEHASDCFRSGAINLLLEWMRDLPKSSFDADPRLCSDFGWALALTHQFDRAKVYLQQAEQGFQNDPHRLGIVLAGQAYIASLGDLPERAVFLGTQALDRLSPDDLWMRSVCWLTLGIAYWDLNDLEHCENAMQTVLRSGRAASGRNQVTALAFLGQIQMIRLDFDAAQKLLNQAITPSPSGEPFPGCDIAFYDLAAIQYELDQLEAAEDLVRKALAFSQLTGNSMIQVRAFCLYACIKQAQGDLAEAETWLQKAHALEHDQPSGPQSLAHNAAFQVELDLAKGDFASAEKWAAQIPEDIHNPFLALPGLARAHWLARKGDDQAAYTLSTRLLQKVQEAGWASACLRLNLVRSLASPHPEQARQILIGCLAEASRPGWVRPFIDLGQPMLDALIRLNIRWHAPDLSAFVDKILMAANPAGPALTQSQPAPQVNLPAIPPMLEPLSDRELEVLQLLYEEPNYEDIARKLVLSTNTIKTHLKHIYGKLGVASRRAALARARELHLIQ